MFEGIIIGLGTVKNIEKKNNFQRLSINLSGLIEPKEGDSVSINGTCLTATDNKDGNVNFDVIEETLQKTNLGDLKEGDKVNLEKPLGFGNEINGHLIQGHVETVSLISKRIEDGENVRMFFEISPQLCENIFAKGSIAIDGISLTVVDVDSEKGEFSVALIPETLKRTTLGFKKEGDQVNIETDILMKGLSGKFDNKIFLDALSEQDERIKTLEKRIKVLEERK